MKFEVNLKYHLPAHKDCIYTCCVINRNEFFTAGGDGHLLKWDLRDPSNTTSIAKTDSSIYYLVLLDESLMVIGTNRGNLYLLDITEKKIKGEIQLPKSIFTGIRQGNHLYIGMADGFLAKIELNSFVKQDLEQISNGHIRKLVKTQSFGNIIAATSANELLFLNENGLINKVSNAHADSVFALYCLDENKFISGGKDAVLKLWDLKSYQSILDVPAHMFAINDIAYIPQYHRIITASRDKSIKIWDPETLLLDKVIDRSKIENASSHSVNKLGVLDPNTLLAVGDDRIVRVYNLQLSKCL